MNCKLLAQLRRKSIAKWIDKITELAKAGLSYDEAIEEVMKVAFDSEARTWPPFFSTIRAHFGMMDNVKSRMFL